MVQKERTNDDPARPILTETERIIVKVAKEEAIKHIEKKYKLSSLIPFLTILKDNYDTRKFIWNKVHEFLGIDQKARGKLILLTLLIILLTLIIGPSHTLSIVLKWLGDD